MAGKTQRLLYELAEDDFGFVTTESALAIGIPSRRLAELARRGTLVHVSRGVYRLAEFPRTPLDDYMAATLWPLGTHVVVSHESVLELLELCDVNPAKIHLTVPVGHRTRRIVPPAYEFHHANLASTEVAVHDGISITTVKRAVEDCLSLGTSRNLLIDAINTAKRHGLLTPAEATQLTTLTIGSRSSSEASGA